MQLCCSADICVVVFANFLVHILRFTSACGVNQALLDLSETSQLATDANVHGSA